MGFFVYITDECWNDAKNHNVTEQLENLEKRLYADQRADHLFDNFPLPYLKKRFSRQHRLIASERFISLDGDQHIIVCFYRILIRGNNTYEKGFLRNPREWGEENLLSLISDQDLGNWLLANKPVPAEPKPEPDEFEKEFLWNIRDVKSIGHRGAEMIYESKDWMAIIANDERFKKRLINFPDSIMDICTSPEKPNDFLWSLDRDDGISLMACFLPGHSRVFLIAPVWNKNKNEIERLRKKYDNILTAESKINEDELAQRSGRAYPYELLLNKDLWMAAEEAKEANLALSAEEANLLEDVQKYDTENSQKTGLPLFINGRAGSGKSTVLQYLFADYLRYYILHKDRDQYKGPLYSNSR